MHTDPFFLASCHLKKSSLMVHTPEAAVAFMVRFMCIYRFVIVYTSDFEVQSTPSTMLGCQEQITHAGCKTYI